MDGLTEGRIVHYVMPDGQHRPATVVRVWDPATSGHSEPGVVNMQVLLDGTNDHAAVKALIGYHGDVDDLVQEYCRRGLLWVTSVHHDLQFKPGTWHWIEKA